MCNFFNTSQRTFIQVASHSNSKLRKLHWKPNGICVICDFSEIPCVSYYVVSSNGIHSAWYSTDCLEFHQSNISFHSTTFLVLFTLTFHNVYDATNITLLDNKAFCCILNGIHAINNLTDLIHIQVLHEIIVQNSRFDKLTRSVAEI